MSKTARQNGPGRPAYQPKYPRSKEWTFDDWCEVNEVETNPKSKRYGKGPNCSMLTLRKNMKRDMFILDEKGNIVRPNYNSVIVKMKGVTADPNSAKGLGRRANVYSLREKVSIARKARTPKAKDVSQSTQDYEATKAALLAPEPTNTAAVTTPAVTITPTPEATPAPVPTPAPAVAETPVASESANAETATPTPEAIAPAPVAS